MRNQRTTLALVGVLGVIVVVGLLVTSTLPARSGAAAGRATPEDGDARLVSVGNLLAGAKARTDGQARVGLAAPEAGASEPAMWMGAPSAPNYLRAFETAPHLAAPLARLVRTVIYEGALPAETKAAMGLRVAQVVGSPYVAAHTVRLLRPTPSGRALLEALEGSRTAALDEPARAAVEYADLLTRSVHGVSPEAFARTRSHFDDREIVELTMTVAFFNYFTRLVEGLQLPVEPWAIDGPAAPSPAPRERAGARVALISDAEIAAVAAAAAQAKDAEAQRRGLGLGMANSQRAMLRAPELALAWRAMGTAFRERPTLPRETMLQVSLAVSMVNGCRYCTIHQVLGLRRQGVDPGKLVALQKDDAVLTARERVAVEFARALTTDPAGLTDEEYERVRTEFGEAGALEVLLQTCNFAFMNRFTDGLGLPSEDDAVRVYQEVYGTE